MFIKRSILIVLFVISINIEADELKPIIGYGYATSVLPEKNQEAFVVGFELGFKKILGEMAWKKFVLVERDTSGDAMGAMKVLKKLFAVDVKMITGFPTSHEALQVAEIAGKRDLLTIFPAAGHPHLADMGPYVMTTGESTEMEGRKTIEHLKKIFPHGKGLFVYNPQAVFSVNQKEIFVKLNTPTTPDALQFNYVSTDDELKLSKEDVHDLQLGKYHFVFISMYPDESYQIVVRQFPDNGIDLPIVTNSSWTTGDIGSIRRGLSTKNSIILTGSTWLLGNAESREFEDTVKREMGVTPSPDVASGYDLGVIVATVIKRVNGNYSKESLYAAFDKNRCFDGLSIGQICFPKKGGHGESVTGFKFIYLNKKGLQKFE